MPPTCTYLKALACAQRAGIRQGPTLTVPNHPHQGTDINPDVPVAAKSSLRLRKSPVATPESRKKPWPKELEGFCLDRYPAAGNALTPFQWGQQLAKRKLIQVSLDSGDAGLVASAEPWVSTLFADPLAPYPYHIGSTDLSSGMRFRDASAVSELSVDDLQRLTKTLPKSANGQEVIDQLLDLQGRRHGEDGTPVGNPWSPFVHLKIDLHATDVQLQEQFLLHVQKARDRTGLSEVRKHANSEDRSSADVMEQLAKKWVRFNVLPLLDIAITCQQLEIDMPSTNLLLGKLPRRLGKEGASASYLQVARQHAAEAMSLKRIHELLLMGGSSSTS
jgi:hypothetical protein